MTSPDSFRQQLHCRIEMALEKFGLLVYKIHIYPPQYEEESVLSNTCMKKKRKRFISTKAKHFHANKYLKGFSHGTSVIWVLLPDETLVGVDSQKNQSFKSPDTRKVKRVVQRVISLNDSKFEEVVRGVTATLCGDADRCKEMVNYVKENIRMYKKDELSALDVAGLAACGYFHDKSPRDPEKNVASTLHLCSWDNRLKKYKVIEVGDHRLTPLEMTSRVFGTGSGSENVLADLAREDTIDVDMVKAYLLRSSLLDPYSGGYLKVFSLKDGVRKIKYTRTLIMERRDPHVQSVLTSDVTMFVIIRKEAEEILSRLDLIHELEVKGYEAEVFWLHYTRHYLVYRVVLSSKQLCDDWFASCDEFRGSIRRQQYSIEEGICEYYLGHASSELLELILQMKSFEDLAP